MGKEWRLVCAGKREGWGSEKASPKTLAPLDLGSSLCSPKGIPLIHCEELSNYPIFGPLSPKPSQNRRNHEGFLDKGWGDS